MPIDLPKKADNLQVIEKLLRIRNKRGELVPFRANAAQKFYWERRTRRNLILKARQKGLSKMIDADQLIDCVRRTTNAVVISHERTASQRLFEAVRFYIENLKVKPTISIDSKSAIHFPKRASSYFIGTAGQKAFGRGDTLQRSHLSEAAFYEDLERILAGIEEATEYGQIDIETTPNGRDAFHDLWQKAKSGRSSYTAIFIPWFIDEEYSIDSMTPAEKSGLSRNVQRMFWMTDEEFRADLDDEEKEALRRIKDGYGLDLPMSMMKWRRYKIWDKGRLFYQEYPEDDVSCFLSTGGTVFGKVVVDQKRMIPLDDFEAWARRQGWSEEKRFEFRKKKLFAGMDCAEGVRDGDRHAFAVIEADADSAQASVIFELVSDEPYEMFDAKVAVVCREFNINLGLEVNAVGLAHKKELQRLRTRFTEWETTAANRPSMIAELEEAYRKTILVESYKAAEDELLGMVYTDKKTNASSYRAEARPSKHDDRVIARAIGWQMRKKPVPKVSWA